MFLRVEGGEFYLVWCPSRALVWLILHSLVWLILHGLVWLVPPGKSPPIQGGELVVRRRQGAV